MIDLCNKKILVCAFPWKILKNFAGIRQSPTICIMKCSEQSALDPHENTICTKPQCSVVGTGVARFLIGLSDLPFSFLQVLSWLSALRRSPWLFQSISPFSSSSTFFPPPHSTSQHYLSVLHTVLSAVIVQEGNLLKQRHQFPPSNRKKTKQKKKSMIPRSVFF